MSFILDALRKVDHENRQGSEPVPPVVAVARLAKERVHRRRQLAVMAAIGLLSAVSTAVLMRNPSAPSPVPQPLPTGSAAALDSALEVPVEKAEPPKPAVAVPEPVRDEKREESKPEPPSVAAEEPVEVEAFVPVPPAGPPHLVLQGTSVLDGKPVAVVSDRRVFEGDTIEGAVVIRIDERSVELEFEGRRFTLSF